MAKNLTIPIEIHRKVKALAVRRGVFLKALVVELLNIGMAEMRRAERGQARGA